MSFIQLVFLIVCVEQVFLHEKIDVVFTLKNLEKNQRFQSNFVTMIESLHRTTSNIERIHLHLIADQQSREFVNETLNKFHFSNKLNEISIENLTENFKTQIEPVLKEFSSSHDYYKDPLFFLSPFLHEIFPSSMKRLIMLDIDIRFENDIANLYELFDRFDSKQILGIARENQPVYRHLFWKFRQENPQTLVGSPPPNGLTGFNSGVLLLNLERIRRSEQFHRYLTDVSQIQQLRAKYFFNNPHLGDQDFYTLLSFEHPEWFFILPCTWNRQLCSWWKGKGYDDVWSMYFECNNEQNINLYHGNCNTPIPTVSTTNKFEL